MTDCGAAAAQPCAWSKVSCSPANTLHLRVGIEPGRRPRIRSPTDITEGTENQWLSRCVATKRAGVSRSSCRGTTRVAPACQVTNMSKTDGSKVRSNDWDSRLPGPTSYRLTHHGRYS